MRADVQKPIQSLHSFGRHYYRGRCAALPLVIFDARLLLSILLLMIFIAMASAEQQDTNRQDSEEKQLDVLFDRLMQTMPDGAREQVDSAGSVAVERRKITQSGIMTEQQRKTGKIGSDARDRLLPDELKAQVERTIVEMKERKAERKAQFRESRHHK